MPFKSEAQRKYLWANEPEIARDWTDTYGSGIQAAHGGRIGFRRGTSGAPGGGDPGMTSDPEGKGQTFGGTLGGGEWSPGVGGTQHIPTPKVHVPDRTPDRFPDRGIRTINYGGINIDPNKRDTQSGWGKFVTKMRGWNEEKGRPNTQQEYEDARQNRRDQSSIDRIRETRDTKYANDPRGWDKSDLSGRLAGLEKGQWERMSAMGMPTDTVYPSEGQGIGATDVAQAIPYENMTGNVALSKMRANVQYPYEEFRAN